MAFKIYILVLELNYFEFFWDFNEILKRLYFYDLFGSSSFDEIFFLEWTNLNSFILNN